MGWVSHFDNSDWQCKSNCSWDGDSWNVAGPGLVIETIGTWDSGYRPTEIRITATNNATGFWDLNLKDANGSVIASVAVPNGSSQVDTADISFDGYDVDEIVDMDAPGTGQIENIEFYELAWNHDIIGGV